MSACRRLRLAGPPEHLAVLREQLEAKAEYVRELRLSVELESAASALTVLTGIDGGVKLREAKLVPLEDIFSVIEAMPMRRWEKRSKN